MNINPEQVNQVLNMLHYPISKDTLVQKAREHKLPDQVMTLVNKLPNQEFKSADDVKNALGNLSNLGGIGGKIGGLFK